MAAIGWRYATKAEIAAAAKKKKKKKDPRAGWRMPVSLNPQPKPGKGTPFSVGNTPVTSSPYAGMSDEEIARQAGIDADSQLAARSSAIERIRAAAAAAARRDQAALQGLGDAQMKLLAPIPGQITGIRNEAGAAIAGYGKGYSDQVKGAMEQGQGATAATVAEQGQPGAPTVDAAAAADAAYAQGGEIPATEQTQIGAASGMAAAGMPAVVARAAQEDILQRMAEAAVEDAGYRAQLLDLAAERPGLVNDALSRLYDIEDKKFGRAEADRRFKLDQEQLALQERAQAANEKALKIKNTQADTRLNQSERSISLRESKYLTDLQAAEAKGQTIDAPASNVLGYVVDKNGNPILGRDGKQIAVVQNGKDKAAQAAANRQKATTEALAIRGKPIKAPDLVKKPGGSMGLPAGQYKGRPGAKGLFPDGTTNDPNRAQRDGMTFAQAQTYLMNKYGLSRAGARQALIAAGWKPGS